MRKIAIFPVLLLLAAAVYAKAGMVSVSDLAARSDVIVVARVTSVNPFRVSGVTEKHAVARVLEVWKGEAAGTIYFLASPTWNCDTSAAEKGEIVLLFLNRSKEHPPYVIAHSGRGRMRVRGLGAHRVVDFAGEVRVPQSSRPTSVKVSDGLWSGSLPLEELHKIVRVASSARGT